MVDETVRKPERLLETDLVLVRIVGELDGVDIDAGPLGRERRVGVKTVVARDSTAPQSNAGLFVQRVLAYIRREAARGIGVRDVARKFKVSTSLLELRFRSSRAKASTGQCLESGLTRSNGG